MASMAASMAAPKRPLSLGVRCVAPPGPPVERPSERTAATFAGSRRQTRRRLPHLDTSTLGHFHIWTPPHQDTSTLGHLHIRTLPHQDTSTLGHFHIRTPPHQDTSTLGHFHIWTPPHQDTSTSGHLHIRTLAGPLSGHFVE
eukprot:7430936-Pyramimonas_sp.AAC.1